jgi:phytoene synthase
VGKRELTAAGITDPHLRESYRSCQRINAKHGRTYYLATQLLPPAKRPAVHALYAFARSADDIVDSLDGRDLAKRSSQLDDYAARFFADVERGYSPDLVLAAAVDTIHTFDIPLGYFQAFIESMQMDLSVKRYQTYSDLDNYVYGSAVVIGLPSRWMIYSNSASPKPMCLPVELMTTSGQRWTIKSSGFAI